MRLAPIPGLPGYSASDDGRIFSHWHRDGFGPMRIDEELPARELRQFDRRTLSRRASPYRSVCVIHPGTGRRNRFVHELVLLAFVGERPGSVDEYEACHGPGGSLDNSLENLRWDTIKANTADRVRANYARARAETDVEPVSGYRQIDGELEGAFDDLIGVDR